jgi:hypothetical protein
MINGVATKHINFDASFDSKNNILANNIAPIISTQTTTTNFEDYNTTSR